MRDLARLGEGVELARGAVGAGAELGGLVAGIVALEKIAVLAAVLASVANGAGVAVVGVD